MGGFSSTLRKLSGVVQPWNISGVENTIKKRRQRLHITYGVTERKYSHEFHTAFQ